MATQRENGGAREFSRLPTMIPVHVEIAQAWQATDGMSLPGGLINVSCGGAGVRLRKVLPPRTKLVISVPTNSGSLQLQAEVVWTSVVPERGSSLGVYGIRWLERLSPRLLDSLVPKVEHIPEGDSEDGSAI